MKKLRRFWWNHMGAILSIGGIALLLLLIILIEREQSAMIDDCVATTGRDFYECRALVKAGSPRQPVIINPGRGY